MAKFLSRKTNKPKAEEPEEISVPEITPAWLTALLSKYGEEAAPYGDAPTRPSLSYADEALPEDVDSDDDISDVLADIAVSAPSERIASSVDWGAPPAEVEAPAPSSAMDNLLASFGAGADAEEVEPEPPEADLYPADTPDWLDDVAAAPVAETPPEPPPPPAVEEAETPDWLDDISSKSGEMAAPPAASADPGTDWLSEIRGDALPTQEEQSQVPDWLAEFAAVGTASLVFPEKTPPPEAGQPEMPLAEEPAPLPDQLDKPEAPDLEKIPESSPAPPPETEEAAPSFDWLDEMEIPEPAQSTEAPPPETEEAATSFDWLDEMEIPESAQPAEAPPPAAEDAASSFDWLDEMEIPESAQPAETPPPAAEETAPDWLSGIAETAAVEQTAASTTEPSPSPLTDDDDLDADWLAEVAAAYPIDPAIAESVLTANDAPLPEPASDHPAEEDTLAATSALGEIPDWLAAGDAEEALQAGEATPFGDLPDWMQDETEAKPDWLTDAALPQDEETEAALPDTFEPAADLPEWLRDATQETEAEIEALMVEEPPTETDKAEEEDGLDWKTGAALGATGAALDAILASTEPEPEGSPAETEAEAPDWLAELQDDAEDVELGEAALPDWIQVEAEPEAETPGEEIETPAAAEEAPDWLAELQGDAEAVELEEAALPDWIQVEAEPEVEAPDEAETPAAAEEALDWLTELQDDVEGAEPETATEAEEDKGGLDWKTGAALGATGAALGAALSSTEDEAETPAESAKTEDIPDWLAELYKTEETDTAAEVELPTAEAEEPETKTEAAAEIELPAEAAEAEDGPDWKTVATFGAGAALLTEAEPETPLESVETEAKAIETELPAEVETDGEAAPWSAEAQAEVEIEAEAEAASPGETAEVKESPDWLAAEPDAQKTDIEMDIEALAELSAEDAESPAWLQGLQTEIEAEALEIEEAPIPDWLAEEPEAEAATAVVESAEPLAEGEDEGGLDWKTGAALGAAGAALGAALLSEEDQAEEPAGTMGEIETKAEIEAPVEAKESDESPAWLAEMQAETEAETPEVEEVETPLAVEAEAAMSAWLIETQAKAETETEAESEVETKTESPFAVEVDDDILNWLSEADAEPEVEVEAELPEPDATALPERLQADEPAEVEAVAAEEAETEAPAQADQTAEAEEIEEDESVSNLATGAAIGAAGAALGSILVEDETADALPDWMTSLSEGDASGAKEPPHLPSQEITGEKTEAAQGEKTVQAEDELPDWMGDLFSADEPEEKIDVDAPEWMLALETDDEEKEKPKPEPPAENREEGEDEEDPFEGKAGLALGAAGLAAGAALTGIGSATPSFDLHDEDEPSAEESAQIAAGQHPPPDMASTLPPWMEELPEPDFGAAEESGAVEHAVADLQDVVPVPAGAHSPLRGDAAVEPGAIGMDAAREFYGIVSPAAKTPPGKRQASSGQTFGGKALNAGLHLLFLALIAIPLFAHYDRGGYPYPWLEPSPIQQQDVRQELQNAIVSQPPDSIALVSFDYTPATAGEMDPLAAIVIKNLLGQGLRVIAVSLEPEGQAVASSILAEVSDEYGERVLNLGYLPGGPVAVRRLLDDPLFGTTDIESGNLYASLDNWPEISRIDDFSLVVEIAANPDTARWWAEQLQKEQPSPTMLAAVSAAAEPFVRPYRDAGQYTALISGINGAAALESARVQKTLGPATAMLDSLSVGSLIVLVLMFVGTIAGLISRYGE